MCGELKVRLAAGAGSDVCVQFAALKDREFAVQTTIDQDFGTPTGAGIMRHP
jgi:hypothetical protein